MKKIYRTIFREFRFQKIRTFLAFLCMFVIVAFPVALFSIGPTIETSVANNNQDYHLAYLDLRFQGNHQDIISKIEDIMTTYPSLDSDYSIELRATTNYQLLSNGEWYLTNIVAIDDNNPPEVNQVRLIAGTSDLGEN